MTNEQVREVTSRLAEPFDPREVKFKPQSVKGNRALAIAYVDVRVLEDRLDEVVGVAGWQDAYEVNADGSVICRLRLKLGEEWVEKSDVGSPSDQPDTGDRLKAAFSDALKRACVKFGLARYLYRIPNQWVDYDPTKKQIVRPPQLPAFAMPKQTPQFANAATAARGIIAGAKSMQELQDAWNTLPDAVKAIVVTDKDRKKAELQKAGPEDPAERKELLDRLQLALGENGLGVELFDYLSRTAKGLGINYVENKPLALADLRKLTERAEEELEYERGRADEAY